MSNILIPEGFKDDVTSLVSSEHKFKNMIINHFQLNGFDLVKTPLIEYLNKNTDENTFKISVTKNQKKLNLRDDITLQIARLSQTRLYKKKKPLKLCYYGEVVRKKGTMLRPERQFLQIGAECIGEENFLADVEMMELAFTSLNLVGIQNITIEISSRVFYDYLINNLEQSIKKVEIKKLIKLKDLKGLLNLLDKKKQKYAKDLFCCTGIYKDKSRYLKNLDVDESTSNEIFNIRNIVSKFSKRNKKTNIFLDLCEVDDKNYHSGVRFTFFAQNVRGEIARGGRYFVKNSNNKNDATGFTCYMDTILRASSEKLIRKKIMVPFNLSKTTIKNLIAKSYIIVKYTRDLKITNKIAKDHNCQFYLENNIVRKI